jgi:hypothetical protein
MNAWQYKEEQTQKTYSYCPVEPLIFWSWRN